MSVKKDLVPSEVAKTLKKAISPPPPKGKPSYQPEERRTS